MLQLSMWALAATIGLSPAPAPIDAVPPEADVVIRVRGLDAIRGDLNAMLTAMSPALGAQAAPALEQALGQFRTMHGEMAASQPFLTLIRVAKPDDSGSPPFAIVVSAPNYEEVIKSTSGGKEVKLKREEGGFDSYTGPGEKTWYSASKGGSVIFGADKALVASFAKGEGKALEPAAAKAMAAGDVGVYVNVKALASRYADVIAKGKEGFLAALDQAGGAAGNAGMMESIKPMYGAMFDAVKLGDALAFSLDFAAEGLVVDGEITVLDDSPTAAAVASALAKAPVGDASGLARLPADSTMFAYMNIDAATFGKMYAMGMRMMNPGGNPDAAKVADLALTPGPAELVFSFSMSGGMKGLNVTTVSNPKALFDASKVAIESLKGSDSPLNVYKDVSFTPEAQPHAGFTFSRAEMTIDFDKVAKMQPGNPAAADMYRSIIGGDKFTSWYGVDATRLIQVTAPSWEVAKAQVDAYLKGGSGPAGLKAARAKFPERVSLLVLMSAQGIIKQVNTQFGALLKGNAAAPPAPADLPAEPALIGGSVTPNGSNGLSFRFILPSTAGPVFEKGFAPLMPRPAQP